MVFFFMESDTAHQKESIALFFMILGIFFRGGQIFGVLNTKITEIQKSARRILSRKINCACFYGLCSTELMRSHCSPYSKLYQRSTRRGTLRRVAL
ncbi:hypothetical protein JB92DRAFT_2812707 [Gautieria morchelliformis]|nr:hypothetical protein JB92DRAFT_2812707 [Gautieria morchelliformis]